MNKKGTRYLRSYFDDTSLLKVGHNIKFDLSFLQYHDIEIPSKTKIHDTQIQHMMLNNLSPAHSLDYCAWVLFGWDRSGDAEIKKLGKELGGYQNIPKKKMHPYQVADGQRCMILHKGLFPEIAKTSRMLEDYNNEMDLIFSTIDMETHGLKLNKGNCNNIINRLYNELDLLNDELYEHLGYYANLGSTPQVRKILFDMLGYSPIKNGKDGPSVDLETITALRKQEPHQILDLILKYRTYTKGTAMVGSYLELADSKGILHPGINTNGARKTGRESSSDPNLQNVSKGTNPVNPFTVPARECFESQNDEVLFLVDYAGIEMRLIVEASGCESLRNIINSGGDVHLPAAKCLYGEKFHKRKKCFEFMFGLKKSNKKIVKDLVKEHGPIQGKREAHKVFQKTLRGMSKNAHFAMAYGAGPNKLAETLQLSNVDATDGFNRYAEKYPEVAYFTKNTIKEVREKGYITTPFGRRLYVEKNKPYKGSNYKIQGFAAGILKRAQVYISKWLKKHYPSVLAIMPIHDELIIKFPKKLLGMKHIILKKISRLMINIPYVQVRLDVEWKMTFTTWDKAKGIPVEY